MCDARSAEAFEYFPNDFSDEKDSLFWALISYDNKRFVESSNCLIFVKEKINEKNNLDFSLLENSKSKEENSFVELSVRALLADCYVNMGEERLAEKERSELLGFISSFGEDSEIYNEEKIAQNKNYSQEKKSAQNKNQIFEATLENQEKILSSVYLNSALYALKNSDYEVPYRLLTFVVNKWQDFVPGLIAYGNFSYDSNLRKLDDSLTQELRRLKISSMQMKAFDEFPAIPVEDALYKMKESLARQKDVKLYVALLELEDKYFRHSDEESLAKLYQTLERNSLGTNLYPTEIIHYAVSRFLILERVEEASSFFNKFIIQKYKFNENENFYDEFFKNIYKIENWEIEYAAWFAANEKKANLATNLYEFCVINRAEQNHHLENQVSPFASTSAIMNLAMIYSSTNNQNKAFEIYGQAANLTKNIFLKSECFYRIGILYQKKGDAENAIKSLKHSIYLNPSHSKARLLLSKLVKI